jgi:hypothetical protein
VDEGQVSRPNHQQQQQQHQDRAQQQEQRLQEMSPFVDVFLAAPLASTTGLFTTGCKLLDLQKV